MTCIIGVEHDGVVYMGADSITLNGWARDIIAGSKIFKRCGMLFGCAGNPRMAQILQYHTTFKPQVGAQTDEEWLVCEVIETIRLALREHGFTETENGRELGASFLLGYKGRIYSVEGAFQLCRSARGLCAMGAADDFALGALCATLSQFETWDAVKISSAITHALTTASQLSSAVAGPFVVETLTAEEVDERRFIITRELVDIDNEALTRL